MTSTGWSPWTTPRRRGPSPPPRAREERSRPRAASAAFPFLAAGRTPPGNTAEAPAEWPGVGFLVELVDDYQGRIQELLAGLYDADEIARRWTAELAGQPIHAAGSGPDELDRARAGGFAGGLISDEDVYEALLQELINLLGESYVTGTHAADELLAQAGVRIVDRPWDAEVDWSEWIPGNTRAAAELAGVDGGRGLAQLLQEAQVTIKGIDDATLQRMGEILAQSANSGLGTQATARRLRELLDDPARATMIAQTELARATTVASIDSWLDYGVTQTRWLLSVGACPKCVENAAAGVIQIGVEEFPNGNPPVHPRCVCALAPVVDEELLQAQEEGTAPRPEDPNAPDPEAPYGPAEGADPVADWVTMKGKSSEYQELLDGIGDLHGMPTDLDAMRAERAAMGRLSAKATAENVGKSKSASGAFYSHGPSATSRRGGIKYGDPLIRVYAGSTDARRRALTFVHELGHYLDCDLQLGGPGYVSRAMARLKGLGAIDVPGMERRPEVWERFLQAVKDSPSYRRGLEVWRDRAYYTDAAEIWARAYSQWVATVAPDLTTTEGFTLWDSLESRREAATWELVKDPETGVSRMTRITGEHDPEATAKSGQWEDDEFGPIAEAVEAILRDRGALK